jgi:signal recognition particle receptor subunit beta
MATINYAAREINVKIVYYGPALSGKTTNLQIIHKKTPDKSKSDMVSLATEADRTLFFDFLPIDLGKIRGFTTKIQLYTVPGQVYYNATRKLVLRGVDGIVFVADSSEKKMAENIESLNNMEENLAEYGYDLKTIPVVLQFNKRDKPDALPAEVLNQKLNRYNTEYQGAVANKGKGVFETLKIIGKEVIDILNRKYSTPNQPGLHRTMKSDRPAPQKTARPAPAPQRKSSPPAGTPNQKNLQAQIEEQQRLLEKQKRELEEQQRKFEEQKRQLLRGNVSDTALQPPQQESPEEEIDLDDSFLDLSTSKTQEMPVVSDRKDSSSEDFSPPGEDTDEVELDMELDSIDDYPDDDSADLLETELELEQLVIDDPEPNAQPAPQKQETDLDDSDNLISNSFIEDDEDDAPLDLESLGNDEKKNTDDDDIDDNQLFFSTVDNTNRKNRKKPVNPKYKKNFLDNLFNK